MSKIENIFSLTTPVVISYPTLFEPKAAMINGKPSGEPKYSGQFLFPSDSADLKKLKEIAVALAKEKWPGKQLMKKYADGTNERAIVLPWKEETGDVLADKAKTAGKNSEYLRGKIVWTAKSKNQPILSIWQNNQITELTTPELLQLHADKFYAGVQVLAEFCLVAYDPVGSNDPGVTTYLNKVCSINKGDRLASGGRSSHESFQGYVGSISAEDPTAPGADQNLDDILF